MRSTVHFSAISKNGVVHHLVHQVMAVVVVQAVAVVQAAAVVAEGAVEEAEAAEERRTAPFDAPDAKCASP